MRELDINRGWHFDTGAFDVGRRMRGDFGERIVDLPHDYMIGTEVYADAPSGASSGYYNAGLAFYVESPTNQQFVILPNKKMHLLEQQVLFTHWMPYDDDSTVCRFVTSWATKPEDIQRLRQLI